MIESDFGTTAMAMQSGRYVGDETLLVRFYSAPRKDITRSREEGRLIAVDVDYIEIMQPGNKDSIVRRPATDRDKDRFAEHYRKYKAREEQQAVEGTPLEEWPAITRSQCEELRFLNIRTVEQLAAVSDSNAQNVMGINGLKQKAKDFLESSNANDKLAARIAELEALLESKSEAPKKRGRPKKEAEAEASETDLEA